MRRARRLNRPGLPGSSESAVLLSNDLQAEATLNLDFRTGILDPRIDFQRTTTGTYYRGPFNQNLALHSEAFNNWTINDATVVVDQVAAPNGTVTADKIVDNTVLAGHTATRIVSFVSGQQYTFSVYAKRGELDFMYLRFYAAGPWATNKIGIFDLLHGTAQSSLGSPAVSITDSGNGWYRCSITATANGATGNGTFGVLLSKTGTTSTYTGTGTEGIFVWGAQLTEGSSLTPYIPTTTAAITQGQIAAAGINVPRFENDPITGEARGLLIEGGVTNLCLQSAAVRTSPWSPSNLTTAGTSITAPDGTASGVEVVAVNAAAIRTAGTVQQVTASASTAYTWSIFLKAKGTSVETDLFLRAQVSGTVLGDIRVIFNNSTGAVTLDSVTGWTANAQQSIAVENGWYRVTITGTTPSTTNQVVMLVVNGDIGDGVNGVYAWGSQLEAQSFASSYIPTTTATVARGADSALMTGTNFSSWFNQAEGTIYAETLVTSTEGGGQLAASVYQNANTYIDIGQGAATSTSNITRIYIRTGGVDEAVLNRTLSPLTLYASARMAGAYRTNDAAFTLNGLSVVTDATVTLPSAPIELRFGQQQAVTTSSRLIRRFAYWPTRLPNATLQALTT